MTEMTDEQVFGTQPRQGELSDEQVFAPENSLNPVVAQIQSGIARAQAVKPAGNLSEAFEAGLQISNVGLAVRGKMPGIGIDENAPASQHYASLVGQTIGDIPSMVAGGLIASEGGPVLATAGAFALPTALRAVMMDAYEKGDFLTWDDAWKRTMGIMWETGKAWITGVATGGVGVVAKPLVAGAPVVVRATVPTVAEIGTMVTVGSGLEGRLPTSQEFIDGAIVIGGIKASMGIAGKLRQIYTRTGMRPAEVITAADKNPELWAELASGQSDIPRQLQPSIEHGTNMQPGEIEAIQARAKQRQGEIAQAQAEEPLPKEAEAAPEPVTSIKDLTQVAPEEQPAAIGRAVEDALVGMKVEPVEAKASATLWESFFRTAATRYGLSAGELIQNYGVDIKRVAKGDELVGALYQQKQPMFYSELGRQLEGVKQESAPAEQWKGTIKNLKGVKAAEVEAVGLNEWLDLQKGPVSKQAIADFIANKGVKVEETTLGGEGERTPQDVAIAADTAYLKQQGFILDKDPEGRMWGVMDPEGDIYTTGTMVHPNVRNTMPKVASAIDRVTEYLNEIGGVAQTRFSQWQLPGGQNYRELVLSLPVRSVHESELPAGEIKYDPAGDPKYPWAIYIGGKETQRTTTEEHAKNSMLEEREFARKQAIGNRNNELNFRSSHFDQPNVLAHIRFNERTDSEGKRVLFLEEIQSDWAQKGKKEGFAGTRDKGQFEELQVKTHEARLKLEVVRPAAMAALERNDLLGFDTVGEALRAIRESPDWAKRWDMPNQNEVDAINIYNAAWTEASKAIEQQNIAEGKLRGAIPSAPFVAKTEAWVALSLRRMISYAAENGYDRIAWTTGAQQVERYTSALRQHVDSIDWKKTPEGVQLVGYKGKKAEPFVKPERITELPEGWNTIFDRNARDGFQWGVTPAGQTHARFYDSRAYSNEATAISETIKSLNILAEAKARQEAERNDRKKVVDTTEKEDVLSDAIGKAMADRIIKDPAQSGTIEGNDIKIDDTGMATFYDRIVPNIAKDVLKKLGGGKVTETAIETGEKADKIDYSTGGADAPRLGEMSKADEDTFGVVDNFADGSRALYGETTLRLEGEPLPVAVMADVSGIHIVGENAAGPFEVLIPRGRLPDDWTAGTARAVIQNMWSDTISGRNRWEHAMVTVGEIFKPAQSKQQSFEITPAMRDKAMEGLPLFQPERGMIQFGEGKTVIGLFESADRSTFLHETGHFFLQVTRDLASRPDAPELAVKDWAALAKWLKIEGGEIPTEAHEKFARGFEAYLREGKAPNEGLKAAFEQFRKWLTQIYKQVSDLNVNLSDDVRQIMDRMLTTEERKAMPAAKPPLKWKKVARPAMKPDQIQAHTEATPEMRDKAAVAEMMKNPEDLAVDLQAMVGEAGWSEKGGMNLFDETKRATQPGAMEAFARTTWIPRSEWFGNMRRFYGAKALGTQKEVARAVEKFLAGEKLKASEGRTIEYMVDQLYYERSITAQNDNLRLGLDTGAAAEALRETRLMPEDAPDMELITRASGYDEGAVERAATQHGEDDLAFMVEIRRIISEHEAEQGPEVTGGGEALPRTLGQEKAPADFALEKQTPEELIKREALKKLAKDQALLEAQKAEADRLRGTFTLTGSDREADLAAAAGQEKTLFQPGAPSGEKPKALPKAPEPRLNERQAATALAAIQRPLAPIPQMPGEPTLPTHMNYNYIGDTAQVKESLARLSDLYEAQIQTARRGTVGWKQSFNESAKVLGDLLGASPEEAAKFIKGDPGAPSGTAQLMARKKLAIMAAESLMAKRAEVETKGMNATGKEIADLLVQVDNTGAMVASFLGARAETARALNIMKAMADDARMLESMADVMEQFGGPGQVNELIARLGQFSDAKQVLIFTKEVRKATTWEKFMEAWRAGLISGLRTYEVNFLSNTVFTALRIPIRTIASLYGTLHGGEKVELAESMALSVGMLKGTFEGTKMAAAELMTGEKAISPKVEQHRKAIEGRLGEAVRFLYRGLSAMDEFGRAQNKQAELYSLATRQVIEEGVPLFSKRFAERIAEITDNPPAEMLKAAEDVATRFVFQTRLGEKGRAFQKWVKAWGLEWLFPFTTTPGNIFKETFRMTPILNLAVKEWRDDFAKGGAARDLALAEVTVGAAIMSAVVAGVFSGVITGGGTPDKGQRSVARAAGWKPYAVKIGNKYYDGYIRMAPVGPIIGLAADSAEFWNYMTEEEHDKWARMLAYAFAQNITNQSYMRGFTSIVNVIQDPERYGENYFEALAGTAIPGAIGQMTAEQDDVVREVHGMVEAMRARIPGQRSGLLPKRDVFGESIKTPEYLWLGSPFSVSEVSKDKVRTEAMNIGFATGPMPKKIDVLPGIQAEKLDKIELTPEQRDVFASEAGQLAHKMLVPIVNSPSWDRLPPIIKRQFYHQAFSTAREFTEMKMMLNPAQREEQKKAMNRYIQELRK